MAIDNRSETAVFLATPQGVLATHLHASRCNVITLLIVPSLMEERKSCLSTFVQLSRRLADQDIAVLRFDPRGCGDSPASFAEFTLSSSQTDLCVAAATLRQMYPQTPQIWLGVRTGALLALRQASQANREARPDALILWEPVSGPDFVRQILQRRQVNEMLAYGQARLGRKAAEAQLAAGATLDCDGYPVTGQLFRELQHLQPCPWDGPGLVVSTSADTRIADACHSLAPATTRRQLRLPPFWNIVGHVDTGDLTEATAEWVKAYGQTRVAVPCASPSITLPVATADYTERMVTFDSGTSGNLRGVLHLPATPGRGRIVFLHGWSGDRTGPHRMFVQTARALSGLGFASLRFDFRGRGDSDGLPGTQASIASMTSDARAAIAWLQAEMPDAGPIILLAICSGCKVAVSAAASETAVARLALWSAESMGALRHAATGQRKRMDILRAYARKLLLADTWRRFLRGQVRVDMVGKALAQAEVRTPEEARAEDATLRVFRQFRGDVLFVFGGSDPDAPGSSRAYQQYCREHGIAHTCHTVPHAGHSYYGLAWEQEVQQVTRAWLAACRI